jgi:hypothetical protein
MSAASTALRAFIARNTAELLAGAFAIGWFFYLGYGATLAPTNIAWMLRGDWAAYLWGFAFYRNAEWLWPVGNTPNLFFPFGTSTGLTDANPWVSLLFKALSPVLPERFQFSGMWYLLCFVLLAVMGARIAASLSEDKWLRALSGALLVVSPLLPSRNGHIALCAFFFVAAGVHLNLAPARTRGDALRLARHACLWLAWAAGTHGYLSAMLLALSIAAAVRLAAIERVLRAREAALAVAGFVAIVLGVYWLFGFIGGPPTAPGGGFGRFSSDLSAFINPMGWSRFVPAIRVRPTQGEGFAYLGLGVLGLLAVRVALSARAPASVAHALRRHWPLLVAVFAMWLYALSHRVSLRGEGVLYLGELYAPFKNVTGIFRSSGRFAWPLYIVLVAVAVSAAARFKDARIGRAVLLVAVLLQASELKASRLDFHEVALRPLKHPAWAASAASYEHLALAPLHLLWTCPYDPKLVNRLAYEAYRRRWTFNSGNFGRKPPDAKQLCDAPIVPDRSTIYVPARRHQRQLERAGFSCGPLDGLTVCVASDRPSPLLAALRAPR